MINTKKIWMDGSLIDHDEAKIHVLSHVIHYGSSFFEGIRAYKTKKGTAIFRLDEHVNRLFDSCKIYYTQIPFTKEEIKQSIIDTVRENNLEEAYIRPIVYRGYNVLGVDPTNCPVNVTIAAWEWKSFLGESAIKNGIDAKISSWARMAPNTIPALAKAGGNYLSSQLIRMEAMMNGYEEGLALNTQGELSEGSGENIFVIKDNIVYTPTIASSALFGITRDTVIKICKVKGYYIIEQSIPRELLYIADEVFIVGTAAEITPLKSIDRISIGNGSFKITSEIQNMYYGIVKDEIVIDKEWLTYVY
ncbi:branched-chain amino acid transaminase [Clostridium sp. ZS2-4]|uniref:branched-chain amino acid transaminase n=1 Tax=Clostridium sp. ZS2-4 TaxID=2987703 RepID=UPI00227C838D|nr:branched-chain amino acid transaminase [Clostridium sp. ZS2-4]MCY6355333.1 branched-chain amino acid transaminase [Clostridium sp. ZS2-4]